MNLSRCSARLGAALAVAALVGACGSGAKKVSPIERAQQNLVASVHNELAGEDFTKYDDDFLAGMGQRACDFLNAGQGSYAEARTDLEQHGAPKWMSGSLLGAALVNLCPAYIGADIGAGVH